MQYLETGSEPSPIDCFKKFHTKKDGKEWATDRAKTLYVCNLYQSFNFVIIFSFFVVLIIHVVFFLCVGQNGCIKAKAIFEGTTTNDY